MNILNRYEKCNEPEKLVTSWFLIKLVKFGTFYLNMLLYESNIFLFCFGFFFFQNISK